MTRLPHWRFLLFLGLLALAVPAVMVGLPWHDSIVGAFDLAAAGFLASVVRLWTRGTAQQMRARSSREDGGLVLLPVVAAAVTLVILIALALVLRARTALGFVDLGLVLFTLVLAWCFVNTVFALHYARIFYDRTDTGADSGGLDFPGTPEPSFSDFCYFSFVIGMTFQVSDVAITAPYLRQVAMIHGILAFFYNLGVLALVINVLAGIL